MFGTNRTKNATTSTFRSSGSRLPSARPREAISETPIDPPSYITADRQKGAQDKESDAKDKEDAEIKGKQGKSDEDEGQPMTSQFKPPKNKVTKNEPSNQPSTDGNSSSGSTFNSFWNLENDIAFEEEVFGTPSYWTPNFFGIVKALQAASMFSRENRIMLKNSPEYSDYATYIYYAILFYIQILRAQREAGQINGKDSSFLRRFERKYPPESLPITSFLEPAFHNIASVLPDDVRHSWIIPQYGAVVTSANGEEFNDLLNFEDAANNNKVTPWKFSTFKSITGVCLLQPIVPYMIAIHRTAMTKSSQLFTTLTARRLYGADYSDTDYPFWTNDDQFLPLSVSTVKSDGTRAVIATRRFSRASMNIDGNNQHDDFARIIASPGLNVPYEATPDSLEISSKYWARTSFMKDINVHAVNTTATANPADGNAIRHNNTLGDDPSFGDLENFLLMPKSSNLDWFEAFVTNATVHARFYSGVIHLTDIPATTGMAPLILAEYKNATGNRFGRTVTADTTLDRINRTLTEDWFFEIIKNPVASFYTSRAALDRSEELQALTFGTNGSIPFTIANAQGVQQRIGATTNFRSGSFFEEDNIVRYTAARANASSAKEMFKSWKLMIQTDFALPRPTGY
jgi:hypothetical protein